MHIGHFENEQREINENKDVQSNKLKPIEMYGSIDENGKLKEFDDIGERKNTSREVINNEKDEKKISEGTKNGKLEFPQKLIDDITNNSSFSTKDKIQKLKNLKQDIMNSENEDPKSAPHRTLGLGPTLENSFPYEHIKKKSR